jgi:pimeloyl-ACP methyl ester carboxylesterase
MIATACGGDDDDETPTPDDAGQSTAQEATATEAPGEVRPVIFVPGVGGTKLAGQDGELWALIFDQIKSLSDDFLTDLALEADGETSQFGISVDDILRTESIEILGFGVRDVDFYGALVETFAEAGYAEGEMLFVFPYDWRLDIDVEAARLKLKIDDVLARTGAEQVDIVAHSMGGMVALAALGDSDMDGKVAKLVTLGTPVLGATKALGVLEFKALCFTEEILDRHCITNTATAQQVMTNFPSAYQLLPSRAFDDAVGSPFQDGATTVDFDGWTSIVRANRNAALLDDAHGWQADLPRTPHDENVEMLRVVGSNKGTPVQIERRIVDDCFAWVFNCEQKTKYFIETGTGDGTVPLASASLLDATRGFDQSGGVPIHPVGVGHMALAQDEDVLEDVLDFLNITTSARIASIAPVGTDLRAEYDREPELFDGAVLTVVGPAWGQVRSGDELTGPVPGEHPDIVYEGIDDSSFWRVGDVQHFVFNGDGDYRAELSVVGRDSLEYGYLAQSAAPEDVLDNVVLVTLETYDDGEIDDTTIFRVEPTPGATLYLDFQTDGDPDEAELLIDRDDDGETDEEAIRVEDFEPLPAPEPTATEPEAAATEAEPTETEVEPTPTEPSIVRRPLIELGPNNQLEPGLIEAWEISEEGNQITVAIGRDVILANGDRLTGEIVAETLDDNIERLRQYEYIGSRPVDDFTLVIVLGTTLGEQFLAELSNVFITVRE